MARGMFCVVIIADGQTEALAATASACVSAVADGLVGHGVVVAAADDAGAARVADAMGADLAPTLAVAARAARGEWALILAAGDLPGEGWMGEVERLALAGGRAGYLPRPGLDGAWRRFMSLIGQGGRPGPGWVLPLTALTAGAGGAPVVLAALRRRVAGR
jgi:hypothetical protein